MRKLNGQSIPEGASIDELEAMLQSPDMHIFALGCKGLEYAKTPEAYGVLKAHLSAKDKYKLRCLYESLFSYDESSELQETFIRALQSDEYMFVNCALNHLTQKNLWASHEQILLCIEKNHNRLNPFYYQILSQLPKTESNAERIIALFRLAGTDSLKIALAELLPQFALESNYIKLYEMLFGSGIVKLRLAACRIAHIFGKAELLESFNGDPDGHLRKYAAMALAEIKDRV